MQTTRSIHTDSERKRASVQQTVTHKDNNSATIQQNQDKKGANRTCGSGRIETYQEKTATNGKIGEKLENEVHQDMAVIDAYTGKLLNYKQLMRYPD